jgi:hypothetical protein
MFMILSSVSVLSITELDLTAHWSYYNALYKSDTTRYINTAVFHSGVTTCLFDNASYYFNDYDCEGFGASVSYVDGDFVSYNFSSPLKITSVGFIGSNGWGLYPDYIEGKYWVNCSASGYGDDWVTILYNESLGHPSNITVSGLLQTCKALIYHAGSCPLNGKCGLYEITAMYNEIRLTTESNPMNHASYYNALLKSDTVVTSTGTFHPTNVVSRCSDNSSYYIDNSGGYCAYRADEVPYITYTFPEARIITSVGMALYDYSSSPEYRDGWYEVNCSPSGLGDDWISLMYVDSDGSQYNLSQTGLSQSCKELRYYASGCSEGNWCIVWENMAMFDEYSISPTIYKEAGDDYSICENSHVFFCDIFNGTVIDWDKNWQSDEQAKYTVADGMAHIVYASNNQYTLSQKTGLLPNDANYTCKVIFTDVTLPDGAIYFMVKPNTGYEGGVDYNTNIDGSFNSDFTMDGSSFSGTLSWGGSTTTNALYFGLYNNGHDFYSALLRNDSVLIKEANTTATVDDNARINFLPFGTGANANVKEVYCWYGTANQDPLVYEYPSEGGDISSPLFSSQSINATPKLNEEVAMAITMTDDNPDSYIFFWNGTTYNDNLEGYVNGYGSVVINLIRYGTRLIAYRDSELKNFTIIFAYSYEEGFPAIGNATKCYVIDGVDNSTVLATGDCFEGLCTIDYNLTAGNEYNLMYDREGDIIRTAYNTPFTAFVMSKEGTFSMFGQSSISSGSYSFDDTKLREFLDINVESDSMKYDAPSTYTSGVPVTTVKQVTVLHGDYCWGVIANDTFGNEATSDIDCFTVGDNKPAQVTLYSPIADTYKFVNVSYSASDADGDPLLYYIYINDTLKEVRSKNITHFNILAGTYRIKVSAYDGYEFGENSTEVTFTSDYTLTTESNYLLYSSPFNAIQLAGNTITPTGDFGVYNVVCAYDIDYISNSICSSWKYDDAYIRVDFTEPRIITSINMMLPSLGGYYGFRDGTYWVNCSQSGDGDDWITMLYEEHTGSSYLRYVEKQNQICKSLIYHAQDCSFMPDDLCAVQEIVAMYGFENAKPSVTTLFSPVEGNNYTSVDVKYSASDSDLQTLTYYIYVNDILNVTSTENITGLSIGDGTYSLKVSAYDGYEWGDNSTAVTFTKDSAPPVVTVQTIDIDFNETYNDMPLWINFTTDESALCTLDNSNWSLIVSSATSFAFADTNSTPEGLYDIKATCEDALLNSGVTDIYFYVDRTPPYVHFYNPNHYGTTSLYTLGSFIVNVSVDDLVNLDIFNLNITKVSDNTLMWSIEQNISGLEYSYVNILDVSSWENTTYKFCSYACDVINCDVKCADFIFRQPHSPVFTLVTPLTPVSVTNGQTVSLYALANDSNTEDVLTYRFLIDHVYVSNEYFYDYLISGHIGDEHSAIVEVYDNSIFNYTSSYTWNMTLLSGFFNTYDKHDFQAIVVNGMGVAGSAIVGNLELIITMIVLVVGATIVMGFIKKRK